MKNHGKLTELWCVFFIACISAFCTNKISNHQLHLLIPFLGMFGSLRMATISMMRCVSFTLMIATSNASGSSTIVIARVKILYSGDGIIHLNNLSIKSGL